LERLEHRWLPSTVNWNAGSGDFNNPNNWTDTADNSHHVPGSGDDAVINVGTNFAVTVKESHTLKSLTANVLLDVSNNAVLTLNNFFKDSSVNDLVLERGSALKTTAGTTTLTGGGYLAGNLDVAGSALLDFTGGTQALNDGVSLSGLGQFTVAGATLTLDADLSAPANLELDSGSLGGPSTWTVDNGHTMKWTGGTMAGTGTTLLTGGATLSLSGTGAKDLDTRSLVTAPGCTVTWKDSGSFRTFNGPVITNNGTWDLQSNASLFNQGGVPAAFTNTGTFQKSAGIGTSSIGNVFNNQGGRIVVSVAGGTLSLPGGTSDGGGYTVIPSAAIDLTTGQTQNITGTFTGTGGGAVYLDNSGVLNILPGGATLAFDPGMFQWYRGTIDGLDTLTNAGDMTLLGTGAKDFANSTLSFVNAGTLTWEDSGSIRTFDEPALENDGTWTMQSDAALFDQGGDNAVFTNTGTLQKVAGTGTSSIGSVFNNAGGTLSVQSGIVVLSGGGTSLGGTFDVATPLGLDFSRGTYVLTTGTSFMDVGLAYVNGATVSVQDVVSAGDFQVSGGTLELTTTGILNLAGTYTQAGGSLVIDFQDQVAGDGYGQLNVTGKAGLGGNLYLTMLNGYRPDVGTVFTIITYGTVEGQFDNIFGTDLGGGIELDPVYGDTALTLTTVSTTAPGNNKGGRVVAAQETLPAAPAPVLRPAADGMLFESPSPSLCLPVVDEALALSHDPSAVDEAFRA
jgi:hypothetical protein